MELRAEHIAASNDRRKLNAIICRRKYDRFIAWGAVVRMDEERITAIGDIAQ